MEVLSVSDERNEESPRLRVVTDRERIQKEGLERVRRLGRSSLDGLGLTEEQRSAAWSVMEKSFAMGVEAQTDALTPEFVALQERAMAAEYRVGQLELRVRNAIGLIEAMEAKLRGKGQG